MVRAVVCGAGIGFGPFWLVQSLVDRCKVEIILADFEVARVRSTRSGCRRGCRWPRRRSLRRR